MGICISISYDLGIPCLNICIMTPTNCSFCADECHSIQFNLFIKHDRSLHKLVRQGTNKNKINVLLLLLLILEQVNKRHSNIFTKRTEYESQGKQIDN